MHTPPVVHHLRHKRCRKPAIRGLNRHQVARINTQRVCDLKDVVQTPSNLASHLEGRRGKCKPFCGGPGKGNYEIGGATFLDAEYRESDVEVEVWLQVPAPFVPVAPLTCQRVPARRVVMATLKGSYDGVSDVTAAIGAYLAANRLETGPMFNIYRISPMQNPDPAAWVTDICFPIVG